MSILVLYSHAGTTGSLRAAIKHHLRALESGPGSPRLLYFNAASGAPAALRHLNFDAVILHTTFLCARWSRRFQGWKARLSWVRDLECPKIALPQDEYDYSEVLDEWFAEWGVNAIFTNFGPEHRGLLYPRMEQRARFFECFTGYIDEGAARAVAPKLRPAAERRTDLVYRAAHLPYWFGSQGQLKHRIAAIVGERARAKGLRCDISTRAEDTIVGDGWLDFLASSRAVIGCESGSSVLDRRGEVRAQIQALLSADPGLSFEEVGARMPAGWDDYRFFAISPRHFEAIITKTCQVLVEGTYDGVLTADKHYIPIRRDFSNLDEALEKVRDDGLVTEMTARAYEEVYGNARNTYRQLAADLELAIRESLPVGCTQAGWASRALWPLGNLAGGGATLFAVLRGKVSASLAAPIRRLF